MPTITIEVPEELSEHLLEIGSRLPEMLRLYLLKAFKPPQPATEEASSSLNGTEETHITLIVSPEDKQTLEKSAAMRCLTLSEYLLEIALDAATVEIPPPEQIVLSNRDWDLFSSALSNPPQPNEALKSAIKNHQEKYGKW